LCSRPEARFRTKPGEVPHCVDLVVVVVVDLDFDGDGNGDLAGER
jgi:hypothetical protein